MVPVGPPVPHRDAFRRRLIAFSLVLLLGVSLVLLERLAADGPSTAGGLGTLLVIAGAALELGAVWLFLRRRG